LLRLGVPFAVFVGLLWPLLMYPVHPPGETPVSYWSEFLRHGSVDTGVMWFAGVLLLFSLAYAGWVRARGSHADRPRRSGIVVWQLLALNGAVTVTSFLIRLALPYYSDNPYIDLNLYQWPECLALFGIGVAAARAGWLTAVPDRLYRGCRTATLATVAAFGVFVASAANAGVVEDEVWGGWHWPALVFAALESALAVFGSVWMLGIAQRHLDRPLRWAGPTVRRSAYGAFMVQGFVLIGLAVALRPVPLPAEIKAVTVATGAVLGSFWLARLLVRHVPGMARIL
jgi:hypothetical protein